MESQKLLFESLPHTWEGDIREPILTIKILGEQYGLFCNSLIQNIEIALVLGGTIGSAIAVSWFLFKLVVEPKKENTTTSYILGLGLIVPFWIFSPMYFIQMFGITNKVFRFVMGTVPTLSMFRTLEAIYGFCPSHICSSWKTFALYYSSPFLALYDSKKEAWVKADTDIIISKLMLYIRGVFLTGAIHSLFLHFPKKFIEFGGTFDQHDWYSFRTIFRLDTLWKNICFAAFFQIYLATSGFGLQLITILLTGFKLEEMWVDPLSKSASFSDFWSRRWNLSVHTTLKRGVFKPVRRHCSKYVALMATFLCSGLFHEWLVWITFSPLKDIHRNDDCSNGKCFQPTYGPATVFFLFQAFLIAVEFGVSAKLKSYTEFIPMQLATILIVCIGGSLAHWFSDGYVHSSFFLDSRVAYVLLKRIDDGSE